MADLKTDSLPSSFELLETSVSAASCRDTTVQANADGSEAPCADESVGYLLARVRSSMSGELQQLTQSAFEMSGTQASMLMLLKHGHKTGADLAREYGIDASAVTRLLDKLEDRGLVTRCRSEADRRVVHLVLTAAGWAFVDQLRPLYAQVLDRMLAGFSQDEAGSLKSLLKKIILNCETGPAR